MSLYLAMEFEEIDALYTKECEDAKEQFLIGLKQNQDVAGLEKTYQARLKKSREKYYSLYQQRLKQAKIKKKRTFTIGHTSPFIAEPPRLLLTSKERSKYERDYFKFKMHLRWRHFKDSIVSLWMLRVYYSIKVKIETFLRDFKIFFLVLRRGLSKFFGKLLKSFIDFGVRIWTSILAILKWIYAQIKKLTNSKKKEPEKAKDPKDQGTGEKVETPSSAS